MSRRKKIIIIAVIFLLVILVLMFLILRFRDSRLLVQTPPAQQTETLVVETTPPPPQVAPRELAVRVSVENTANIFTERFGSYSAQSNFQNLRDVKPLVTDRYWNELLQIMSQGASASGEYYGVTTRVISVGVVSIDDEIGEARVEIGTQREEFKGGPTNSFVRYATLRVDLEKLAGVWLVDSAVWLP